MRITIRKQVWLQVQAVGLKDVWSQDKAEDPHGETCIIEDVISTNGSHAAFRGQCQGWRQTERSWVWLRHSGHGKTVCCFPFLLHNNINTQVSQAVWAEMLVVITKWKHHSLYIAYWASTLRLVLFFWHVNTIIIPSKTFALGVRWPPSFPLGFLLVCVLYTHRSF